MEDCEAPLGCGSWACPSRICAKKPPGTMFVAPLAPRGRGLLIWVSCSLIGCSGVVSSHQELGEEAAGENVEVLTLTHRSEEHISWQPSWGFHHVNCPLFGGRASFLFENDDHWCALFDTPDVPRSVGRQIRAQPSCPRQH